MAFEIFSDASTINILGNNISIGSIIIGIVIMIVGVIAARIISTVFNRYFAGNLPDHTAKNLHKLIYYGIIIITLLVVTTSQGVDLSGLIVAGGIFGIVIGFATQSVVSNAISGIFLMFDKPAKTGDLIEIKQSGILGILMDTTVFSTRIRQFDGSIMRVPNEKVFTSEIRNISSSEVRRIDFVVSIAYKEDVDQAIGVIKSTMESNQYILCEPAPGIWTEQLADSGVNLRILTWIPRDEWGRVGPVILKDIKKALDDAGIEIPFPQRTIHFSGADKKDKLQNNGT